MIYFTYVSHVKQNLSFGWGKITLTICHHPFKNLRMGQVLRVTMTLTKFRGTSIYMRDADNIITYLCQYVFGDVYDQDGA